jgi:hypothetical protein
MKENNLLQKKLAKYTKKYLMPMKIMLPILEKKRFRIASRKKICNFTCDAAHENAQRHRTTLFVTA